MEALIMVLLMLLVLDGLGRRSSEPTPIVITTRQAEPGGTGLAEVLILITLLYLLYLVFGGTPVA